MPLGPIRADFDIDTGVVLYARQVVRDADDPYDPACRPLPARFVLAPAPQLIEDLDAARRLFESPPPTKVEASVDAATEYRLIELPSGPLAAYSWNQGRIEAVSFELQAGQVIDIHTGGAFGLDADIDVARRFSWGE